MSADHSTPDLEERIATTRRKLLLIQAAATGDAQDLLDEADLFAAISELADEAVDLLDPIISDLPADVGAWKPEGKKGDAK